MNKINVRSSLSIAALLLASGALASCNTIQGAGQDVQAGGAAVSEAATEVQSDMEATEAEREAKEERDRRAAEANQ